MSVFLEDDEIERRINNPENAIIKFSGAGANKGDVHKPHRILKPETKALIGSVARMDTVKDTAKVFQLFPSQVSDFKNGHTRTTQNEQIIDHQEETLKSARDVVFSKILESIQHISPEKLKGANPLVAASVAEKMASIHDKLSPKGPQVVNNSQIVYYVPRPRDEKEYPMIETEAISG